jgi:hypothetical protein
MPEFYPGEWEAIRRYVSKCSDRLDREGWELPQDFSARSLTILIPFTLELIHALHTAKQTTCALIIITLITVSFASFLFYYAVSPSIITLILVFGFLTIIFVGFTGILTKPFSPARWPDPPSSPPAAVKAGIV